MICRRDFLKTAGFVAVSMVAGGRVLAAGRRRPNIIYILADDLGYGELGCYGQKLIKTPNIDKLAQEGMKFTDHYSGSTVCAPSRCSLMTGRHTGHCTIRNNKALKFEGNEPIKKEEVTVAEVLKNQGYATGAFGKWGIGYPGSEGDPNNQGFDYFFGYNCQRQAHSYYPDHLWRNDEKVMYPGNKLKSGTNYSHDEIANEALEFVKKHKDESFFLYVPFTIPHTAFQVPDLGQYKEKKWTEDQKTQAAMITRMDGDVGKIMALLKEFGIDDNTLVIFTSDNGPHGSGKTIPHFNGAGGLRGRKMSLYEGGIRVPMIARFPGKIKPGSQTSHVSAFWDVLPTFAELAEAKAPTGIDGISFLPTLFGQDDQRQHEYLYWEFTAGKGTQAVRFGNYKAVRSEVHKGFDQPIELFDLENDKFEEKDIASSKPELVKKAKEFLAQAHEKSELFPFKSEK
ncbi:MAG: arylsulfatase [Phycisphaerae bacterium]|nr:arylsulfatase [Phycisphaerae bacterium]